MADLDSSTHFCKKGGEMCSHIFIWNFEYSGQDILLGSIKWSENYGPIIQIGLQILLVIELKLWLNNVRLLICAIH